MRPDSGEADRTSLDLPRVAGGRVDVAVAEVGHQDLHRRAVLGVAVVSGDPAHCTDVLDSCERFVAARPELDLLSAHRTLRASDDD